jgi:hypothetical protein
MRTTRTLALTFAAALLACGVERATPLGHGNGDPPADPMDPADPGEMKFETTTAGLDVHHPVVAINGAGTIFRAAVSAELQWPVFLNVRCAQRFPGEPTIDPQGQPEPVTSLAMVASADGRVHAVWSDYSFVHYARFDTGLGGQWMRVAEGDMTQPTTAVSPEGIVTIAYAGGRVSREPTRQLLVIQGTLEDGFSSPVHVNPDCCEDDRPGRDSAYRVSVAALHVDDLGFVHLAYQWRVSGDTYLDYISNNGRTWYRGARFVDVSTDSIDPAFAVAENGLHFAYVTSEGDVAHVLYKNARESTVEKFSPGGTIQQLRMDLDAAGVAHFAVSHITDRTELSYVRSDALDRPIDIAGRRDPLELLRLTMGAGGSLLTPAGELIVPYLRGDYWWGTAEVAVGRLAP